MTVTAKTNGGTDSKDSKIKIKKLINRMLLSYKLFVKVIILEIQTEIEVIKLRVGCVKEK